MNAFGTKRKMFEQMKQSGRDMTLKDLQSRYAPPEEEEQPATEDDIPGTEDSAEGVVGDEQGGDSEGAGDEEMSLEELLEQLPPDLVKKLMAEAK